MGKKICSRTFAFLAKTLRDMKEKMLTVSYDFLTQTSLHGFKHIAETSNDAFERTSWILTMVTMSVLLTLWVHSFLQGYISEPFESGIGLVPLSEVPYPAIVIDAGQALDHMSFIEQSGDFVKPEDFTPRGENSFF